MPKVSQKYRDDRRDQILAAARRCFIRDGFHATSMQDVFAEAGLSSGAVYSYFTGKEAMIAAIAEANLRDVVATIHSIAAEHADRPLGDIMGDVFDVIAAKHRAEGIGSLALLVWGEALRQPALASTFFSLVEQLRDELTHVVEAQQKADRLPAEVPARSVAAALLAVVPGFILQLTLDGEAAAALIAEGVRAMWPPHPQPGLRDVADP
jgi:AcrR family transcriptional regulator